MDSKLMNLLDQTPVGERAPESLTRKLVSELSNLVQKVEKQKEAGDRPKATYWSYRMPFPGVRYYSQE